MSTPSENTNTYDGSAQTGYALGALFGMILFNVALIAVGLILRRISRTKENDSENAVELTTGTFDKRQSNANEDVENATIQQAGSKGKDTGGVNTITKSGGNSENSQHDNGGYVDIDLDKDDAVYESPDKTGETQAVYTDLNEIDAEIPTNDPNYINVTGESKKTESESNICY